ncbi:hypothetical protein QAD02_004878 [Eretmocerus hayati]|uniref:Uncharacterized protein n=1 Tax=Eretmocerus hayati TaxID=131215 RepID=A0ACC2NSP8_9HYME|nr:hypothetical protein QAD02_004878 [Eretmocerus hayati]
MGSKLFGLTIVYLMVMCSKSSVANEDMLLDNLFSYIEDNVSPYKMNVITEDFSKLSYLGYKIVQKANNRVTSSNYDYDTIAKLEEIESQSTFDSYVRHTAEGLSLTFGIMELKGGSNVLGEIRTMLQYSPIINPWFRGRHLINIIKNEDIDLEPILKLAWSWDFINVAVIEWNQIFFNNKTMGVSATRNVSDVYVYSYDPSNEIIMKRMLTGHMEMILEEVKDFGGYPLTMHSPENDHLDDPVEDYFRYLYFKRDLKFLKSLTEAMNMNLLVTIDESDYYVRNDRYEPYIQRWRRSQVELPIKDIRKQAINIDITLDEMYEDNHRSVYIPRFLSKNFYLRRRKIYEKSISFAAIMTFGGLIYTAWLFATWARILEFKEPNWSFLNILTAQMGGSIQHHGPMKLSEMIFQMSIYVATFIIVTLGSDYMYQIFLLNQEMPEIKTLRDLADANIELIMEVNQHWLVQYTLKDSILEKIDNRIQHQILSPESDLFCFKQTVTYIIDDTINLCFTDSKGTTFMAKSDNEWQVEKIDDPISVMMVSIKLDDPQVFFIKDSMEKLITRFSETGFLDSWWEEFKAPYISNEINQSLSSKITEDSEIPLQSQLWPVLLVGYFLGSPLDLGLNRGFSGDQAAQLAIGLAYARNATGPG